MSWNYRVLRTRTTFEDPKYMYQVHEVYYREDGSVELWSGKPMTPYGETLEELTADLELFRRALTLPTLEETRIEHDCRTLTEVKS